MGILLTLPAKTYSAKAFYSPFKTSAFTTSGTLDGCIELAVPSGGTYPLTFEEARLLTIALNKAIDDVERNCLYEADQLLMPAERFRTSE